MSNRLVRVATRLSFAEQMGPTVKLNSQHPALFWPLHIVSPWDRLALPSRAQHL